MGKSTHFKSVVVKEDPKTSLKEAGINTMTLGDGSRVVAVGHLYFPHHDRSMVEVVLNYLRATKPDVVFLLGGIVDEEAFKEFGEDQDNYLHEGASAPEVAEALDAGGFEDQVLKLGELCGKFIERFATASGGKVIYVPSATHLSMGNEVRLMEWIQQTKRYRDGWAAKHPDATDLPSDPSTSLPKELALLFNLHNHPMIHVLKYGSAVLVNNKTLFMIGDFRRRHPGDASQVEWEQRSLNIVRSFDGKVASGWHTMTDHTLPALQLRFAEYHEIGYLWDETRMGHFRDYDRRAPGFFTGVVRDGELFGWSVPILRGTDCRRSFVVDGVPYTEESASCMPNGEEITLAPRIVEGTTGDTDPRRPPAPVQLTAEESGEDEGNASGPAGSDAGADDSKS